MTQWLAEAAWVEVQRNLPILCVDALALRRLQTDGQLQVGLILRNTPHQGRRWCLIGGRVLRGELLIEAVRREWVEALGDSLVFGKILKNGPQIFEYRPDGVPGRPHDPRKHAVSATYGVWTDGAGHAQGKEALEFKWFETAEVNADLMGFGQETVVKDLILRAQDNPDHLSGS